MHHYDYQESFKRLYDKAADLYRSGNKDKSAYFDEEERAFIAANGWRVQDFFDYAEDMVYGGEPSHDVAQSVEQVRRDYFLHVQKGEPSGKTIEESSLPPKKEAVRGIEWLPRIIEKARGKIQGELPDEIMYLCGGDRGFLKRHDIHPAEFLRVVWAHLDDKDAIVDFVESRSPAVAAA